jgi:hypothetical protein
MSLIKIRIFVFCVFSEAGKMSSQSQHSKDLSLGEEMCDVLDSSSNDASTECDANVDKIEDKNIARIIGPMPSNNTKEGLLKIVNELHGMITVRDAENKVLKETVNALESVIEEMKRSGYEPVVKPTDKRLDEYLKAVIIPDAELGINIWKIRKWHRALIEKISLQSEHNICIYPTYEDLSVEEKFAGLCLEVLNDSLLQTDRLMRVNEQTHFLTMANIVKVSETVYKRKVMDMLNLDLSVNIHRIYETIADFVLYTLSTFIRVPSNDPKPKQRYRKQEYMQYMNGHSQEKFNTCKNYKTSRLEKLRELLRRVSKEIIFHSDYHKRAVDAEAREFIAITCDAIELAYYPKSLHSFPYRNTINDDGQLYLLRALTCIDLRFLNHKKQPDPVKLDEVAGDKLAPVYDRLQYIDSLASEGDIHAIEYKFDVIKVFVDACTRTIDWLRSGTNRSYKADNGRIYTNCQILEYFNELQMDGERYAENEKRQKKVKYDVQESRYRENSYEEGRYNYRPSRH